MKKPKKKNLPRHAAGSFTLKEGTGPITAMCSCGEYLEMYKKDKTFRVRSPESIDPEETNPNALWVTTPVDDIGSSNPIVARVFLQSIDMLNFAIFDSEIKKEEVIAKLHSCKELLVSCFKVATKVSEQIKQKISEIESKGIEKDNHGRGLNPFPHILNLEDECGTFLVRLNRAIKAICELPSLFFQLDRTDSNFDYLGKRLEGKFGSEFILTKFVQDNAETVRYLIDLRNYHEHPGETKTIIENFSLTPDSKIQIPMWGLSSGELRSIKEEMFGSVNLLMEVAEIMFIHCIMGTVSKKFPFIIERIPEDKVEKDKPIYYRLSIDTGMLSKNK
ncbi:MAG: hypothetical protein KKB30_11690 [Proteobacteria bacterium]|nr:hypothetical protein [Pseudomonadota bacterium]MBU1717089.1 hypothetical protein [Pseudomonadota bacterium]